jgi:16S rRNA processing protein RimM
VSPGWITIAVIGRARGNKGEVLALPLSSHPERFDGLREVHLFGSGEQYEVENVWWHDGRLVLKFKGIDTISQAEALANRELRVPEDQGVRLDPGEYFQADLVGCEVVDRSSGARLGVVAEFLETGGPGLLDLGDDFLIPFARSICVEIDPAAKRILVDLPEGLREINRT